MFKEGDRVLIGGKEAIGQSYTSIIGKVATYKRQEHELGGHSVRLERDTWYIQEVDLIPIDQGNDSMVALLHTEDL